MNSIAPAVMLMLLMNAAQASYNRMPISHADPAIIGVDEQKFLGTPLSGDYALQDAEGNAFTLGDMMGKPLVLMFSYYRCDGSCPTVTKTLKHTLSKVQGWVLGNDYHVLTISFDKQDDPASLKTFLQHADIKNGLPDGWRMATLRNPQDIRRLTDAVGYKFFWEPRDRVFLHPSVFIILSPEGRVTRYLYAAYADPANMELAITEAYGGEASGFNAVNFLVSACYSYNYQEGRYTLNYPVFIALGALGIGVTSIIGGAVIMKRRVRT